MVSSNDVTITEALAIALAESNDRAFYEYPYSEHDRAEYRAKARALMPALRAHFEERMPEDVQKLVEEVKRLVREGDRRLGYQLAAKGDQAWADQMLDAIQRLEAAYSQTAEAWDEGANAELARARSQGADDPGIPHPVNPYRKGAVDEPR